MRKVLFRLISVLFVAVICIQFLAAVPTGQRLRNLASPSGFLIGTITRSSFQSVDGGAYARVANEEFNIVTCENAMKMDALEPSQNSFNFGEADQTVTWAQNNGIKVHGHTLVWHSQSPGWVQNIKDRNSLISAMNNHIDKVLAHFKGKILVWDVVNEAFNEDGTYRNSFWYQVIGKDFIDLAFQRARQADPGAKLIYNDYNIEPMGAKSNGMYNMIKSMIERGIPIDGVGFQMHLTESGLNYQSFADNMARFAALGLELYVTEMDVRLPDSNRDLQKQATIYREVLKRCVAQPACKAVQVWGIPDKYSWCMGTFPGTGVPLIFDDNYNAKPAYYAVQEVLATLSGTTSTPSPTPTHTLSATPTPVGNGNITVRARGTMGGENLELRINGSPVASWNMTTTYQDFVANGNGQIEVHFTNDDNVSNGLDIQVDYLIYNGVTYQAEDQETNTAVYQNSACGGSYSEMMHCNGYILFSVNSGNTPTPTRTPTPGTGVVNFDQISYNVAPDAQFITKIAATTSASVASYGIAVKYDPAVVSFVSAADNGFGMDPVANNANNTVTLAGFRTSNTGSNGIATLTWKASNTSGASGMLSIQIDTLVDADYNNLGTTGGSASVTISSGSVHGDVNGDGVVTIVDALIIAQESVGLNPPIQGNADVNCDGTVNIIDALMVAQFTVGLVSDIPC